MYSAGLLDVECRVEEVCRACAVRDTSAEHLRMCLSESTFKIAGLV